MREADLYIERYTLEKKNTSRNPVTKLPALRETIDWFQEIPDEMKKLTYLSVSVYEIPKYMYVLESQRF